MARFRPVRTSDVEEHVFRHGWDYFCRKCGKPLVKVVPGGLMGEDLNALDVLVILDHAKTHAG